MVARRARTTRREFLTSRFACAASTGKCRGVIVPARRACGVAGERELDITGAEECAKRLGHVGSAFLLSFARSATIPAATCFPTAIPLVLAALSGSLDTDAAYLLSKSHRCVGSRSTSTPFALAIAAAADVSAGGLTAIAYGLEPPCIATATSCRATCTIPMYTAASPGNLSPLPAGGGTITRWASRLQWRGRRERHCRHTESAE
jgi:hypothetical protein